MRLTPEDKWRLMIEFDELLRKLCEELRRRGVISYGETIKLAPFDYVVGIDYEVIPKGIVESITSIKWQDIPKVIRNFSMEKYLACVEVENFKECLVNEIKRALGD